MGLLNCQLLRKFDSSHDPTRMPSFLTLFCSSVRYGAIFDSGQLCRTVRLCPSIIPLYSRRVDQVTERLCRRRRQREIRHQVLQELLEQAGDSGEDAQLRR